MSLIMERSKTELKEIDRLARKWQKIRNEPMPEAIERLPIGKIRLAVQILEDGGEPFVPVAKPQPMPPAFGTESSLSQWDAHNNG